MANTKQQDTEPEPELDEATANQLAAAQAEFQPGRQDDGDAGSSGDDGDE